MANNKTLELSIKIAGKMDKSLMAALNGSQSQISSFARSISSIGTAGLAAMGTLATVWQMLPERSATRWRITARPTRRTTRP